MPEALRIEYTRTEDGVSIAWTSIGQGPPLVVASSHNGDINMYSSGVAWPDPLADSGRKVLFYDARGSGSSDRQVTDFGLETRVADLKAVIDKAGGEPVALVGRSHGGLAAVAYAARYPENLTHLVLWDAFINGAEYFQATSYTRAIGALTEMARDDWEFFTLTLAHWGTGFKAPDVAMSMAKGIRNGMSAQAYLSALEAAKSIDVGALLPQISVPTLVVVDQTYVLGVPHAGRALASAIPGAQFVSVRGPRRTTDAVTEFITGASARQAPLSGGGTRTVLFTDLVGHTEMMSRLGDEHGRDVLREHERITREVLKANGGTEVKTMGDGFMASFGSVTKAVECAIALQRAFANREGEPLNVRVGLNAGEPIEEEGDLFGATVILASRIAAKADGGEILVADTVRGLCSGKGFLFADRGEFVAKGFEEPVRVYEVSWRT
jgi:class 3 adenylate cyclase/pimeloyl-ACP methyl ester carboxylesterase